MHSLLQWQSPLLPDEHGFLIERSVSPAVDDPSWEAVGTVVVNSRGEYGFSERLLPGTYYYRISAVNQDGTGYESKPVALEAIALSDSYTLAQNYPNPFNPSTSISFSLPASGHVTLKVYDSYGREIRTLVDGERVEGTHTVTFDASDLPSGTYLYKMQSGEFTLIKRMSFLK